MTTASRNVLLVEDHADIRFLLSVFIRQAGHHLEAAASGGEALSLLSHNAFDLLVTDIGLPDMDGFELLHRAAEIRKTDCITISAFPFHENPAEATHCLAHLVKPFDPGELVALIDTVKIPTTFSVLEMQRLYDPGSRRTMFNKDWM